MASQPLAPELLEKKFNSKKPLDRVDAARTAYRYGEIFLAKLGDALDDNYSEVRAYACMSLGILGKDEYIEKIKQLTQDEMEEVRYRAIEAIGNIRHPSCIKYLLQSLSDTSRESVRLAVEALNKFQTDPVVEQVNRLLNSFYTTSSPQVDWLYDFLEALPALQGTWKYEILDKLLQVDDPELMRLLAIFLDTAPMEVKKHHAASLLSYLTTEDDDLRLAISSFFLGLEETAFENIVSMNYIEYLLQLLTDDYEFIRKYAYETLNFYISKNDMISLYSDNLLSSVYTDNSTQVQLGFALSLPFTSATIPIFVKSFENVTIPAKIALLSNSSLDKANESEKSEFISSISPLIIPLKDDLVKIAFDKLSNSIQMSR